MQLSLIAQDDVFPLARALAIGIDRPELGRMVRDGRVHRLHHGWFATRAPVDEQDRHRLRLAALLQQYAGRAVASDASALLLLGLPTYEPVWSVAHLLRTAPTLARRAKSHRKVDLVVRPALVHPGIERVRAALPRCDGRHESPGETVAAWVLHHLGYRTVPQFAVPGSEALTPGGRGYRADLGIVGTRVLVEFDGRSKYSSAQDLWDEKRREDRIRSLGWEIVRLTWADLHRPERVRALVEAAVGRSTFRGRDQSSGG